VGAERKQAATQQGTHRSAALARQRPWRRRRRARQRPSAPAAHGQQSQHTRETRQNQNAKRTLRRHRKADAKGGGISPRRRRPGTRMQRRATRNGAWSRRAVVCMRRAYHGHGRRGGCASERGLHCSLVFVEAVDLLFGGDEQLAALAFHLQAHAWRGASAAAARMRTCAATCLAEAIRAAALAHGAKRCSCGCCASECALKQLSGAARGNAN